jgi:threonine synthase
MDKNVLDARLEFKPALSLIAFCIFNIMGNFICRDTGETYSLDEIRWRSNSGGLLDIEYEFSFDPDRVKERPANLWRYREVIPIDEKAEIISFGEGLTPLQEVALPGGKAWFKMDQLFPSGSYKDRGATVLISQARALGVKKVVQDSSGNAGCAVANYCAAADIACEIFVPESTSPAKLVQIQLYGAELTRVPGSREDTADAARKAAESTFYASHVWNPFFFQGTKTWAYEVCEQMGWRAPDTVILPAGNGTLIIGAYIGFKELLHAGIISQMPRMVGIQAAYCAPLYQAFHQNLDFIPEIAAQSTLAEGIAIALPMRGMQMIEQIRETGGTILSVEEKEIQTSLLKMLRLGYYIEPTTAAVVAGVEQYLHNFAQKDERVVSVLTGHGLKSTEKLAKLI